jgi:hypothetical protein
LRKKTKSPVFFKKKQNTKNKFQEKLTDVLINLKLVNKTDLAKLEVVDDINRPQKKAIRVSLKDQKKARDFTERLGNLGCLSKTMQESGKRGYKSCQYNSKTKYYEVYLTIDNEDNDCKKLFEKYEEKTSRANPIPFHNLPNVRSI